ADAVAVVLPRRHLAHGDAVAILKEDAAGVVAVEVVVVLAVAVERQILDDHVGDVLAAEERKEAGGGRVAHLPEVLAEGAVELEAVAGAGNERPLGDRRAAVVRVLGPQTDAVADLESLRIDEGDFLIEPVGIGVELCGVRRLLEEDTFGAAAEEPDARLQM